MEEPKCGPQSKGLDEEDLKMAVMIAAMPLMALAYFTQILA